MKKTSLAVLMLLLVFLSCEHKKKNYSTPFTPEVVKVDSSSTLYVPRYHSIPKIAKVAEIDSLSLKYGIYGNDTLLFEVLPQDIIFYDTSMSRGSVEIHEVRLRDNFFKVDSVIIFPPVEIRCTINDEWYFSAELFYKTQSQPRYWVSFHFDPTCVNKWKFNERLSTTREHYIFYTKNECNSIEFFHQKLHMMKYASDLSKREGFVKYTDTARVAHEILLEPYYFEALRASNILIK